MPNLLPIEIYDRYRADLGRAKKKFWFTWFTFCISAVAMWWQWGANEVSTPAAWEGYCSKCSSAVMVERNFRLFQGYFFFSRRFLCSSWPSEISFRCNNHHHFCWKCLISGLTNNVFGLLPNILLNFVCLFACFLGGMPEGNQNQF